MEFIKFRAAILGLLAASAVPHAAFPQSESKAATGVPPGLAAGSAVGAWVSLPPLPPDLELAAGHSGWHRALPEAIVDSGVWENLPDGHRVWRLGLRSPGAVSVRLRIASSARSTGVLYVYAAAGAFRVGLPPAGQSVWTPILAGDSLVVEYVPEQPMDNALPFRLESLAHEAAGGAERPPVCGRDVSCDPAWQPSARAVFVLQSETPGGSRKCAGFLVQDERPAVPALLLTRNTCVPDGDAAASAAILWRDPAQACAGMTPSAPSFQAAGAVLIASSTEPAENFSLLRLREAPPESAALRWAPPQGPGDALFFEFSRQTDGLSGAPRLSSPGVAAGMRDRLTPEACPAAAAAAAWLGPLAARIQPYLDTPAQGVKRKAPPAPVPAVSGIRLSNPCFVGYINVGQTIESSLTTSDCQSPLGRPVPARRYQFTGAAGQQVFIRLTSPTMDTYLVLLGPAGTILAEDDDGAGNLNSQIPTPGGLLTLPQTGTYTIEVSIYQSEVLGNYTLELQGSSPPSSPGPFRFVPITPCRLADTRSGEGKTGNFGPPTLDAGATRNLPIPSGPCGVPANARAYSLNITVVPQGPLSYLTVWPGGFAQPLVSTLNSFEGRIVANAAVVPAGPDGSVNVFVTNRTDVIVDINGYFVP